MIRGAADLLPHHAAAGLHAEDHLLDERGRDLGDGARTALSFFFFFFLLLLLLLVFLSVLILLLLLLLLLLVVVVVVVVVVTAPGPPCHGGGTIPWGEQHEHDYEACWAGCGKAAK